MQILGKHQLESWVARLNNKCELMCRATAGLQLVAESYLAIMHALVANGDKATAFKVFQSMLAAGIDPQRGWLQLCKDCFRFGWVRL